VGDHAAGAELGLLPEHLLVSLGIDLVAGILGCCPVARLAPLKEANKPHSANVEISGTIAWVPRFPGLANGVFVATPVDAAGIKVAAGFPLGAVPVDRANEFKARNADLKVAVFRQPRQGLDDSLTVAARRIFVLHPMGPTNTLHLDAKAEIER
jgi:hypothetical protein